MVASRVLCEYCSTLASFPACSLCSRPGEVWASTEESHWAISWFGEQIFFFVRCMLMVYIKTTMKSASRPSAGLLWWWLESVWRRRQLTVSLLLFFILKSLLSFWICNIMVLRCSDVRGGEAAVFEAISKTVEKLCSFGYLKGNSTDLTSQSGSRYYCSNEKCSTKLKLSPEEAVWSMMSHLSWCQFGPKRTCLRSK